MSISNLFSKAVVAGALSLAALTASAATVAMDYDQRVVQSGTVINLKQHLIATNGDLMSASDSLVRLMIEVEGTTGNGTVILSVAGEPPQTKIVEAGPTVVTFELSEVNSMSPWKLTFRGDTFVLGRITAILDEDVMVTPDEQVVGGQVEVSPVGRARRHTHRRSGTVVPEPGIGGGESYPGYDYGSSDVVVGGDVDVAPGAVYGGVRRGRIGRGAIERREFHRGEVHRTDIIRKGVPSRDVRAGELPRNDLGHREFRRGETNRELNRGPRNEPSRIGGNGVVISRPNVPRGQAPGTSTGVDSGRKAIPQPPIISRPSTPSAPKVNPGPAPAPVPPVKAPTSPAPAPAIGPKH